MEKFLLSVIILVAVWMLLLVAIATAASGITLVPSIMGIFAASVLVLCIRAMSLLDDSARRSAK